MLPPRTGPMFCHLGGDVFNHLGDRIPLNEAEWLVSAWGRRAIEADAEGRRAVARTYARPALDLHKALEAARRWRRAA